MKRWSIHKSLLLVTILFLLTSFTFVTKEVKASSSKRSGTCGDGLTWSMNDETETLTIKGSGKITNPEWRDALDKSTVKHIVFDDRITSIPVNAFYAYSNLQEVNLPKSIKEVKCQAFRYCSSLKKLYVPKSMEYGETWCFADTGITEVTFESGATVVPSNICEDAKLLTKINFPNSITKIGKQAFFGCISLENVTLPPNLTNMEGQAFLYCSKIKKIRIPKKLSQSGVQNFKGTGLEEVTMEEGLLCVPSHLFEDATQLTKVNFASTIKSFEESAFMGCTSLSNVKLPSGLQSMHSNAFIYCKNIKRIVIPKTLTNVGCNNFIGTSLEEVVFENGMKKIPNSIVNDCKMLKKVTIPNTVTTIGEGAFLGCTGLANISIPGSVQKLENNCFRNCKALKSIVLLPNVKSISLSAFTGSALTTVYGQYGSVAHNFANIAKYKFISKWKPVSYLRIDKISDKYDNGRAQTPSFGVYDGSSKLIVNKQYTVSYRYNNRPGTVTVTIQGKGGYYTGKVTRTFRIKAKRGRTYIVGNLKYRVTNDKTNGKGTVAVIGINKKATSIKIPNSVKIGNYYYGVTEIGKKAFYKQSKLKNITIQSSKISKIGSNAFKKINSKAKIKVPKKKLAAYTKLIKKSGIDKKVKVVK